MSYKAHAINAVIFALLIITAIIIFMIFVPRYIGLQLEKRRYAAKHTRRSWVPSLRRREKPTEQDVEMHAWPLKYPDPVMIRSDRRHPDDWPWLRPEAAVISERRHNRLKNSGVESAGIGGYLEGFPYSIR